MKYLTENKIHETESGDKILLIHTSKGYVDYPDAVAFMEEYVAKIRNEQSLEAVWFLEHPPIYTAGTSANPKDLLSSQFPVYQTGRGGQYTYHGPNQLVVYVMIDVQKRKIGVREFVKKIEHLIIQSLKAYGLTGTIHEGRVGVWIDNETSQDKIAAIGIRIRRGVSFHGFAVNLAPNLQHFLGIVPCGLQDYGVTSLEKLGKNTHRDFMEAEMINNLEILLSS